VREVDVAATRKNLRKAVVAACSLVGLNGAAAEATEIGSAVLFYTEPDRVSAVEAVVAGTHAFSSGHSANFKLVFDALTGASANGATPASFTQTFTRPSGAGSYQTGPAGTPLDDTFRDTRTAISGGGTLALNRMTSWQGGAYVSTEHDYTSLGFNTSLVRDFHQRNTTVALRAAFFSDTISPEGGRPDPLASMAPVGAAQPRLQGDGNKDVMDLGLGVTRVLGRATVAHLNYTFSKVQGYQTDPYKLVSQVDPVTGDPDDYLFELRPTDRARHVLFGRVNHHLARDVVSMSYRFLTDDWGIQSHTVDLTYRWNLSGDKYLRPHLRWYRQGAADFYRRFLVTGEALPEAVSADYRLGDMTAWTVGLKHGRKVGGGHDLTVRLEYYLQTGDSQPEEAFGVLRDFDLFPDVSALIFQVGYSLDL
jgi:hypothetical protein